MCLLHYRHRCIGNAHCSTQKTDMEPAYGLSYGRPTITATQHRPISLSFCRHASPFLCSMLYASATSPLCHFSITIFGPSLSISHSFTLPFRPSSSLPSHISLWFLKSFPEECNQLPSWRGSGRSQVDKCILCMKPSKSLYFTDVWQIL